jgi:hypothetical protein
LQAAAILARARPVAFPLLVVAAAAYAVGTHEEEHDTRDHRDRIVVKVERRFLSTDRR